MADLLQNSHSFFEAVQFKEIGHGILNCQLFEDLKPMLCVLNLRNFLEKALSDLNGDNFKIHVDTSITGY